MCENRGRRCPHSQVECSWVWLGPVCPDRRRWEMASPSSPVVMPWAAVPSPQLVLCFHWAGSLGSGSLLLHAQHHQNGLVDPKQTAGKGEHFIAGVGLASPSQRPVCAMAHSTQCPIHKPFRWAPGQRLLQAGCRQWLGRRHQAAAP